MAKSGLQNVARKRRAFLTAYAETGNVRLSAECAGVDRVQHYRWLKEDDEYKEAFKHAKIDATERLEQEARRRAQEGVKRLKFDKGQMICIPDPSGRMEELKDIDGNVILSKATGKPVMVPAMIPYVEHEYSDTLLIFLLKGLNPKKYRDNAKVEHTGRIDSEIRDGRSPIPTLDELKKSLAERAGLLKAGTNGKANGHSNGHV